MAVLKGVCEYFTESRYWNSHRTEEDLYEIKRMISSVIYTFEKLRAAKIITSRQSVMLAMFTEIEQLLLHAKLSTSTNKDVTMWELLESPSEYIEGRE